MREATTEAALVFLAIGCGALLLAAAGSWWLARTLASPIDSLRMTLQQMADARDFERPLPPGGASFELDALTQTFDGLRAAVATAEAESEAAYLGVIGALAAALDARDPYTAGHSERVASLSVSIGRVMGLADAELEVLRLGALLHDIGKIGVSDVVLRKPGTLNDDEFAQIQRHPALGARILKPLNFLAEHIAIVELHHEQPDGRGYPHGLKGDDIPVARAHRPRGRCLRRDDLSPRVPSRTSGTRGDCRTLAARWYGIRSVRRASHCQPAVERVSRHGAARVRARRGAPVGGRSARPLSRAIGAYGAPADGGLKEGL